MTESDRKRIERFRNVFVEIEQYLRSHVLEESRYLRLPELVKSYVRVHPYWKDGPKLVALAKIRNLLSHLPSNLASVPTFEAIRQLELIYEGLRRPTKASDHFRRSVVYVRHNQSLQDVLQIVKKTQLSQFPVINGTNKCTGMLTVNGVARWLAASNLRGQVNLSGVCADRILPYEEPEEAYRLLRHDIEAEYVAHLFSEMPSLRAVFLTESGAGELPFVGVVTPWDLVQLRQTRSRQLLIGVAQEAA